MTVYEVVLQGTLDSEPHLNVLHYDVTGSSNFQALCDAFRTELVAGLATQLVSSLTWTGITMRLDVPGAVGIPFSFSGGQLVGNYATNEYNSRSAMIIKKLTGSTVRPVQGRVYQGGIPAGVSNVDGFWSTTYGNVLQASWELLRVIEFDTAGEAVMVIKASNPTAPNTQPYTTVSSFEHQSRPSTQKRRTWNT